MKPIIKQNRNATPSIKEYLDEIKPYLRDIIVNLKNLVHGKFSLQQQLTLALLKTVMKSV